MSSLTLCSYREHKSLKALEFVASLVAGMIWCSIALHGRVASEGY